MKENWIFERKLDPHGFLKENCLIDVNFLKNRTGEVTARAYLVSITEIINSCQQVGSGAFLIVNNYVLGLLWENQCLYVLYSKDENGIISVAGTAVLLKFESLSSLES